MLEINKKTNLTVALVQMQSESKVSKNMQQAIDFLQVAVDLHKAKLIVFPENFLCMGVPDYSVISENILTYVKEFSTLAKQYSVFILLGSVPIKDSNHKCFSRSILINSFGLIVGHYDKIHLFDVEVADAQGSYRESDSFLAGKVHCTLPLDFSRLGLSICYDLRFPELYQLLRKDGAQMISVPSAFTYKTGRAHWEILLRARAIETQCYVLAPNQCGTHYVEKTGLTRGTWGHSMIIDPWGEILCSLQESPGICSANLDFELLENVRNSMNLTGHKRL
jgi:predicted amidohydrolase